MQAQRARKTRPELAGYKLFVFGHSLGGILTPNILTDHPDLAGGVIAACSPRSLWDITWDQNVAVAQATDVAAWLTSHP